MMISVYFLPKLVKNYADKPDRSLLFRQVFFSSIAASIFGIFIFVTLLTMLPGIITIYLPKYQPAIIYLPLICILGVLLMANQYELYFRVRSIGAQYLKIQIITLLVTLILIFSISIINRELVTVLYILIVIRICNFIYVCSTAWSDTGKINV